MQKLTWLGLTGVRDNEKRVMIIRWDGKLFFKNPLRFLNLIIFLKL